MTPHKQQRRLITSCGWILCATWAILLVLPVHAQAATFPPADPRTTIDLDASWRFTRDNNQGVTYATAAFDDSSWGAVTVPHTWNNLDGQDGGSNLYRGTCWYRRHLTVPASLAGQKLFLTFDGAFLDTSVYINGSLIGSHAGGFAAFTFDVTSAITLGADTVIAVSVSNAFDANTIPLYADFSFFGGIYRDVRLTATAALHVSLTDMSSPGVYLKPTAVSAVSANLQVTTVLANDSAVDATIAVETDVTDAGGAIVLTLQSSQLVTAHSSASLVQSAVLATPHLWDGRNDPYLYRAYVQASSGGALRDLVVQPLGLRSYAVDPNTGFTLNGHALDLHGTNLHQDRLDKGWAISVGDQAEDINLLVDIGATFVRLSHYQHHPATYSLLDQSGIIAWSEIPFVDASTAGSAFAANTQQQLQEMIRQNYNHPAICFWGMFNEVSSDATTLADVQALVALAHTEDSTRPTTCAGAQNTDAFPVVGTPDLTGMNPYYGWYTGTTAQFGPWADGYHTTYPTRCFGISEYGAGASIVQHLDNPGPPASASSSTSPHYEEYQALLHESLWQQMAARPYLWEKSLWTLCDFASDFRAEGDTFGRNDKGLVTYDRQTKKDAYFYYKACWSADPLVYITSRRFVWRSSSPITIKIYSNQPTVALSVNGVALPSQSSPNHIFSWPGVVLQPGANQVWASAVTGTGTIYDSVVWYYGASQAAASIVIRPAQVVVPFNGSQVFQAVVLDSLGNPLAIQPAFFSWSSGGSTTTSAAYSFYAGASPSGPSPITAVAMGQTGTGTITVGTPLPPVITSALAVAGTVGVPFSYTISASHGPTRFTASGRPSSLGIDNLSGTVSGIPMGAGTFPVTIGASNGAGADAKTLVITINASPSLVAPAAVGSNPVTGTSVQVTALGVGAGLGGTGAVTYSWTAPTVPGGGGATFVPNGSGAAATTTATFTAAGAYVLQVSISDGIDAPLISTVNVQVSQTLTAILVTPAAPTVAIAATQQMSATAEDQFAAPLALQPSFVWSAVGSGSISGGGLFTASAPIGTATVQAMSGGIAGTDAVTVAAGPATGGAGGPGSGGSSGGHHCGLGAGAALAALGFLLALILRARSAAGGR